MSKTASVISLTKNIVGAGMLALPAGMAAGKGTGSVPALLLVGFSCFLSTYCFNLVGRCVEATGAKDFRELWSLTVGKDSAWLVDAMIVGVCSLSLLTYSCFLGDILASLLDGTALALSRTMAILCATCVITPLCLLPDLSALAPMAYAGVAAVTYSAVFIIKRFLDGSCAAGGALGSALPVPPQLEQLSVGRLSLGTCVLFNMLSTAFTAHTNAVRFYNELENRSVENFKGVVAKAFLASAAFYAVVMLAGYKTFGAASQGLILNNYATSDTLATIARAATGISILGSYPLLFTSLRDCTVSTLQAIPSLSEVGNQCAVKSSNAWKTLTVLAIALTTSLAVLTTDVGFLVSLAGSSFGAAIIFCVPSAIFLAAKSADDKDKPLLPSSKAEVSAIHFLFIFGVFAALFGTAVTVLETFTNLLS